MSLRSEVIRILNEVLGRSKKISEMDAAGALSGSELIEVVKNGENVRTTVSAVGAGGGATVFTDLSDVPSSYAGQSGLLVRVNVAETGLEFTAASGGTWGSITGTLSAQTDLQAALDLKQNELSTYNTQAGATYTLVLTDKDSVTVEMTNGSANTLTVPPNASVAFPTGTTISIVQGGAGQTTIAAGVGVTINSSSGVLTSPSQNSVMVLQKNGTNTWYLWNGSPSTDAVADGVTKGIATFNANDFSSSSGLITIDYANGQKATNLVDGFMSITTQTFAGKKTWTQAAESATNTLATWTQAVHTGGSPVGLLFTGGAHTTLATAAEAIDINFNTTRTVQFAAGAKTTQRAIRFGQPTYSAASATTTTNAYSFYVDGAPIAGTNMTLTNSYAAGFGGMVATTGTSTGTTTFGLKVFNNNFTNNMFSVRDDSYALVGRLDFPAGLFRTSDGITPAQTAVNMTFASNPTSTSAVPFLGFYGGTDAQSSSANTRIFLGTLASMMTFQSTGGATPTFYYWKASPTVNVTTSTTPYYTFHASPTYTAEATSAVGFIYDPTTPSNINGTEAAFQCTSGQIIFNSDISPAQLVANTDDYAPTGHLRALTLRLSTDASRNLTSVAGGTDGRLLVIFNVGAQNLVITDDDGATGTAANRFQLNANVTILPEEGRLFMYDGTSSRWRMIG